jgi:hypothetical protein
MLVRLVESLFGCRHKNYSFPMTLRPHRRRGKTGYSGTYVVCFDCSRELAYDWIRMKVVAQPMGRSVLPLTTSRDLAIRDLAS